MSTSSIKLLGRTISGLLLVAAGGVVAWSRHSPPLAGKEAAGLAPAQTTRAWSLPEVPTTEALADLTDQRLRAPLYDPPPPPQPEPPPVTPPEPPRVEMRLVGTVIEDGRNRAVLTSRDGTTEIRGVGETITCLPGEIVVASVTPEQVVLRVGSADDAEVTLTLEEGRGN